MSCNKDMREKVTRKKTARSEKQGPPIQFRPGVEMEQLIAAFATQHTLPLNEACKALAVLAVTEMDHRFYRLMRQLSDAMDGVNAFSRACAHVHTSLRGARRATGQ